MRSRLLLIPGLLGFVLRAVAAIPLGVSAQAEASPAVENLRTINTDREWLLRRLAFGYRELTLPSQLHNDELQIANDKLEITIAELEDRTPNKDRLAIDEFALTESKEAVHVATSFAQVWSKRGDPRLQSLLMDVDGKFDAANDKCHSRNEDDTRGHFQSLEEAQAACADSHVIYLAVSRRHIATPNGWLSVFNDDPQFKTRIGFGFSAADIDQLKRDMSSHIAPQVKKLLIELDQGLIRADKQIWLIEINSQDTAAFNAKHPDHLMADENDILGIEKKFRQDLADTGDKLRTQLVKTHKPVKQRR